MTTIGWLIATAGLALVYVALPSRREPRLLLTAPAAQSLPDTQTFTPPPIPLPAKPVEQPQSPGDRLSLMLGLGPASASFKAEIQSLLLRYGTHSDSDEVRRLTNVVGGLSQSHNLKASDILACVADQKLMRIIADAAGACAALLAAMR